MATNGSKIAASSCIISIPKLFHRREFQFELADEWEDTNAIGEHCKWVTLGDSLLTVEEDTSAIVAADHED